MLWPLENGHSVVKFTTEGETVAASRPCLPPPATVIYQLVPAGNTS